MSTDLQPIQLDQALVRHRFARAGQRQGAYDEAAVLHREVARRMLERLAYIKLAPRVVLDAGCGTGGALAGLVERFPEATVLALDRALPMLSGVRSLGKPRGVQAWLRSWLTPPPFTAVAADFDRLPLGDDGAQLIWSNLALDWSPDPVRTFTEWRRVLAADGLVHFSLPGPDTLKELRAAWAVAGGAHVHRFIDMHDVGDMLVHAGFADPVMDMETITLTYDDLGGLFKDLRATGSTNALLARSRGLTGKRGWQAMRAAYEALRRDGKLPATFEIIYGHAWKPQPRSARDGHAVVRVSDIGRGGLPGR